MVLVVCVVDVVDVVVEGVFLCVVGIWCVVCCGYCVVLVWCVDVLVLV